MAFQSIGACARAAPGARLSISDRAINSRSMAASLCAMRRRQPLPGRRAYNGPRSVGGDTRLRYVARYFSKDARGYGDGADGTRGTRVQPGRLLHEAVARPDARCAE